MTQSASRRLVRIGGMLVVLLIPLAFDPLSAEAFEPLKAMLFHIIVALMTLATATPFIGRRLRTSLLQTAAGVQGSAERTPDSPPLVVWPYAAAILLATAFSLDTRRSLWTASASGDGALTLLGGVILCWLSSRALCTWRQVRQLALALVIGSVPVVVYGLLQAAGLDPLIWVSDAVSPVLSTVGRSNYLAAYLAMTIPFTVALAASAEAPRLGWRFGLIAAAQLACLLLTLARAAWIGLLLGGLLAGLILSQRLAVSTVRRWRWSAVAAVCLLGGGLLYAMSTTALPQITPYGMRPPVYAQLRADSATARLIFWRASLSLLGDRWLLGLGPGLFGPVVAAVQPAELTAAGPAAVLLDDPHNLWLDRLLATGVVGLGAYLMLLLSVLRRWRCAWRHSAANRSAQWLLTAALAALVAFLVQAQVTPNVMTGDAIFWALLPIPAPRASPNI